MLGTETSTLDDEGEVVPRTRWPTSTLDDVRAAAAGLVGEIEQVPPMVSAVKVGGRRLHELARQGVEVERAARRVRVDRFDVDATPDPGVFRIAVECSSGTYVRVLAADLGRALGGGAHLRHLRRTAIGSFGLDRARPLDALGPDAVLAPAAAVAPPRAVRRSTPRLAAIGRPRPGARARRAAPRPAGPVGRARPRRRAAGRLRSARATSGPSRASSSLAGPVASTRRWR